MPIIHEEEFRAWEACVPEEFRDQLWRFNAYRVALYLLDVVRRDIRPLRAERIRAHETDQLLRAIASVSANVAEGFGRTSSTDRARFFSMALGSLQESFTWYNALRDDLSDDVVDHRMTQLVELRRILVGAQKWLAAKPSRSSMI